MSGSERFLTPSVIRPSTLNGNLASPRRSYGFTPIASVPPPSQYIPQTVRPVPTTSGLKNGAIRTTSGGSNGIVLESSRPYKRKPFESSTSASFPASSSSNQSGLPSSASSSSAFEMNLEPQRKLHLTDDYVAQTMSELYISTPVSKVAKRDLNRDVAEAINLDALQDLESKFSNQALNDEILLPQRIRRTRKIPSRQPQLRLTLHQDLKNVKSGGVLPDSLISRYRPGTRTGNSSSTALVLWKPPGGFLPDLINQALRGGSGVVTRGSRTRCYSEVTSTPYSSHENLYTVEGEDMKMMLRDGMMTSRSSPLSAEAPELSTTPQSEDDIVPSVGLQRRNSAPEISEPLQYMDDERCMEL